VLQVFHRISSLRCTGDLFSVCEKFDINYFVCTCNPDILTKVVVFFIIQVMKVVEQNELQIVCGVIFVYTSCCSIMKFRISLSDSRTCNSKVFVNFNYSAFLSDVQT